MGTIEIEVNIDKKLTTNIAKGEITYKDFLGWAENYYSGAVTEFILWDFTEADFSKITSDDLRDLVQVAKKYSYKRAGGKTAFVSNENLSFGLGRMFEMLSEVEDIQFEYKSFRIMTEAKEWLGV